MWERLLRSAPTGVVLLALAAVPLASAAAQESAATPDGVNLQEPSESPEPPEPLEPVSPTEEPTLDEIEQRLEEIRLRVDERLEEAEERLEDVDRRQETRRRSASRRSDNRISFGNTIWVREDEVASDVVALGSSVEVDGEVQGDIVAVGGSVRVDGRVTGSVTAVAGGVDLGPDAEILGDVTSFGNSIDRDDDAVVLGTVSEVALGPDFQFNLSDWIPGFSVDPEPRRRRSFFRWDAFWGLSWDLVQLAFILLLCCLLVFLFPAPIERVRARLVAEPLKAGLIGIATPFLLAPTLIVLTILLIITLIGILLVPIVWSAVVIALVPLSLFAYTAVALATGDLVSRRFGLGLGSRYVVLLVGAAVLQVLWFIGSALAIVRFLRPVGWMFDLFGALLLLVAMAMGVGAVLLTLFNRTAAPPPPPPPPYGGPSGSEPGRLEPSYAIPTDERDDPAPSESEEKTREDEERREDEEQG